MGDRISGSRTVNYVLIMRKCVYFDTRYCENRRRFVQKRNSFIPRVIPFNSRMETTIQFPFEYVRFYYFTIRYLIF